MTVPLQTPRISYVASGTTAVFGFPFLVPTAADLDVYVNDMLTTSGFSVNGLNVEDGGAVTFLSIPPAGTIIELRRTITRNRTTDYTEGGALRADVLNNDFDRLWLALQDVEAGTPVTVQNYASSIKSQQQTATAGQTLFTVTDAFVQGTNTLIVSVNGALQVVGVDYTETSSTSFTFSTGLNAGDVVDTRVIQVYPGFTTTAANVAFSGPAGAVARSTEAKLLETISVKDFGAVGDGVTDDTTAVQAFINACSSSTGIAPRGYMPNGVYKITSTISVPNIFCNIAGDGMDQTIIKFTGSSGAAITTINQSYFKPTWNDFQIQVTASTAAALDLSSVSSQVYSASFTNIRIQSIGTCLYAPRIFSTRFDSVEFSSTQGHGCVVACGPGVVWTGCYAHQCGTGKAGYRLSGGITMISCNGIDGGDYWGVFGNDLSATDGFQTDFTATDYPDINLIGCNIEYFAKGGLLIHNNFKNVNITGGKIDRSALSTSYLYMIAFRKPGIVSGQPPRLQFGSWLTGSGTATGNGTRTGAYVYAMGGNIPLVDFTGGLITQVYDETYASLIPMVSFTATHDVYGDSALKLGAVYPRRLNVQMLRYDTATLTPVGSSQTIDVTGRTKVIVTPAAAASIISATYTSTPFGGNDYLRNGDLIIEAGNGNLTIVHSASGANTFKLSAGANVTLTAGQIIRFMKSETSGSWVQISLST